MLTLFNRKQFLYLETENLSFFDIQYNIPSLLVKKELRQLKS